MFELLVLMLAAPPAAAAPAPDCEAWSAAPSASEAETRACVPWVLELAYGRGHDADVLELDPSTGTAAALRFPAARLQALADRVHTLCPGRCTDVERHRESARAAEWLGGEATLRFAVFDPVAMASMEPLLVAALAGKPLVLDAPWSAVTLWKLRNAVFARHGRVFDNPDLTRFFYGPDGPKAAGLPRKPSSEPWSDARLTAQDTKNIALLRAAEKKLAR